MNNERAVNKVIALIDDIQSNPNFNLEQIREDLREVQEFVADALDAVEQQL